MTITDFEEHPTSDPTGDIVSTHWNFFLAHGLVKTCDYILRINGSYYEVISGSTGKLVYGGENNTGSAVGTNCTAVWQAMLTAEGNCYICPGTYEVATLTGGSDTTIIGAGRSVVTVIQADGTNGNVFTFASESGIRIYSLTIDGDQTNNPSGDNGINFNDCNDIIVWDVITKNNFLKGIAFSGCYDALVRDCETFGNESDGYAIASITSNGNNSYNVTIDHCNIHNCAAYGIGVITPASGDKNPYNIWLINNYIHDITGDYNLLGINLKGSDTVTISHNHITTCDASGIMVGYSGYESDHTSITDNTIWNNDGHGIELNYANYTLVADNIIYDDQDPQTQDRSVYETSNCTYSTIHGNDVRNNSNFQASMYLQGSYDEVYDNPGFYTFRAGTAEASNNDAISFADDNGLRFPVAPYCVVLTVNESDSAYAAQAHSIGVSQCVLYLYDIVAGAAETTDKTISWIAISTGVT